jgi:hypothetical protein
MNGDYNFLQVLPGYFHFLDDSHLFFRWRDLRGLHGRTPKSERQRVIGFGQVKGNLAQAPCCAPHQAMSLIVINLGGRQCAMCWACSLVGASSLGLKAVFDSIIASGFVTAAQFVKLAGRRNFSVSCAPTNRTVTYSCLVLQ